MDKASQVALEKMGTPASIDQDVRLLRMFLYGSPGSGKTTLAARCVESKGALFSTDSAWVVLHKYPELAKKITRWQFEGFSQVRAFVDGHNEGIEPFASYDTLILDTVSTAVDITLSNLVNAKKYGDEKTELTPGWTHYHLLKRSVRNTIKALSDSDLNVIFVAHTKEPSQDDKEKKGIFSRRPNLPQTSFEIVSQEVQVLAWLHKESKGQARLAELEGTTQTEAKSQLVGLEEKTYKVNDLPQLIQNWKDRK